MPRYHVFPSTPEGANHARITLDCPDDTAAWYAASSYVRAGSADVWQDARYVGALRLTAYHIRMPSPLDALRR